MKYPALWLALAVVIASSPAYAQRGRSAPTAPALNVNVNIASIATNVGFPVAATTGHSQGRLEDGSTVDRYAAEASHHGVYYRFQIDACAHALGGNVLDMLTEFVEDTLESADELEVRSTRAIWFQGFPGVDIDVADLVHGTRRRMRLLVGRQRVYEFDVGLGQSLEPMLDVNATQFFAAVSLDAHDAPSTAGTGQITTGTATWLYPPEGYFAVELPGNAARTDLRITLGDHEYSGYRYSLVGGTPNVRYDVMVVRFRVRAPDDPLATFQERVVGSIGRVRSSTDGAREGYASREVVVDVDSDGTVRTVLLTQTESAIYAVIHTTSRADEQATLATRRRFFSTFRILQGDE